MDYYDVFPRIVPADKVSEVRIRPRYKHALFPEAELMQVVCNPFDGLNPDGKYGPDADAEKRVEWRMDGHTLVIRVFFTGEQEHNIRVTIRNGQTDNVELVKGFRIYSLESDLYELRPYRGDFHIHTTGSDGRETPCYVAARYRQKGFDFAAISDHGNYKPSVEAIDYWKALDLDFRLYPGEEVHSQDNPVHIIHFGGKYSINDRWRDNTEQYFREVAAIQDALPDKDPRVNNFAVAASEWVFDEIRRAGGLCVFCHPYWSVAQNVIDEGITSEIFRRNKCVRGAVRFLQVSVREQQFSGRALLRGAGERKPFSRGRTQRLARSGPFRVWGGKTGCSASGRHEVCGQQGL